jgi:hypothetical protein
MAVDFVAYYNEGKWNIKYLPKFPTTVADLELLGK